MTMTSFRIAVDSAVSMERMAVAVGLYHYRLRVVLRSNVFHTTLWPGFVSTV